MNKNVLIGIVLIALAGAGYYQFSMKPAQEAAATAAADAKAAEEATAKAAEEAAAAAQKVADDAAAAAAAAPAPAATETAPATTETAPAATDAMATLDPANFDAAKVNAMIDASALDAALKTTLKAGVDAAAVDPTKVVEALAAVKTAMGM